MRTIVRRTHGKRVAITIKGGDTYTGFMHGELDGMVIVSGIDKEGAKGYIGINTRQIVSIRWSGDDDGVPEADQPSSGSA